MAPVQNPTERIDYKVLFLHRQLGSLLMAEVILYHTGVGRFKQ